MSLAVSTLCSPCCVSPLVDRLNLWVYPLLLGGGKQVFGGGTIPTALRLTESVTYPNGTLQLAYETAGPPSYGNLAEYRATAGRRTTVCIDARRREETAMPNVI